MEVGQLSSPYQGTLGTLKDSGIKAPEARNFPNTLMVGLMPRRASVFPEAPHSPASLQGDELYITAQGDARHLGSRGKDDLSS